MMSMVHVGISLHHHLGGKQQNVVHLSVLVGIGLIFKQDVKLAGECQHKISSIYVYHVCDH